MNLDPNQVLPCYRIIEVEDGKRGSEVFSVEKLNIICSSKGPW